MSDSHGDLRQAERALKEMGEIFMLIHAGDYYRDGLRLGKLLGCEVVAVGGNCDRGKKGPPEEVLEVGGHRLFVTHGHLYGVKFGLMRLYYRALEVGADVVVFGHTHVPFSEEIEGIYFFNPGSITWPRGGKKATYGLLELAPGKVTGFLKDAP